MRKTLIVLCCFALQAAAHAQDFREKWPYINYMLQQAGTNFVSRGVETGTVGRVVYEGSGVWGIYFPVAGIVTNTTYFYQTNDYLNVLGPYLGLSGSPTGSVRYVTLYKTNLTANGFLTTDYFPAESWAWAPGLGYDVRLKGYSTGLKLRNYADDDWRDFQCRNLFVLGTQAVASVTVLDVTTNKITLNSDWIGAPILDAWLGVNRGNEPEARIRWNESTDRWEFGTTNNMHDLEQVYLNASNWTNWWGAYSNAWVALTNDQVFYNSWSGRWSWVVGDWSNHIARDILTDDTQRWNQAGVDAADWTNWWAERSNVWVSLTNNTFTNVVVNYGTNDWLGFTGRTIYALFNTNVSSGGGGGDAYQAGTNTWTGSNTFYGPIAYTNGSIVAREDSTPGEDDFTIEYVGDGSCAFRLSDGTSFSGLWLGGSNNVGVEVGIAPLINSAILWGISNIYMQVGSPFNPFISASFDADGAHTVVTATNWDQVVNYDCMENYVAAHAGGGSASIGSLRGEVDDLTYRLAVQEFSSYGYRVSSSMGTPYGYISFFEGSNVDYNVSESTNSFWWPSCRTVGGAGSNSFLWRAESQYPITIREMGCAVAGDAIYVFSGWDGSAVVGASYKLDLSSHSWSAISDYPVPVRGVGAAAIGTTIYICGGRYTTACYSYDTLTDTYTAITSLPAARGDCGVVALGGFIYVIGGAASGTTGQTSLYRYNPSSNAWSTMTAMAGARLDSACGAVDGFIYALGGRNGVAYYANTYRYNPVSNAWSTLAFSPSSGCASGFFERGGFIYSLGGYNGTAFDDIFQYDISEDSWTTFSVLPYTYSFGGCVGVNSSCYIIGGYDETGATLNDVESIIPSAEDGGLLTSQSTPLSFTADRLSTITWVESALKFNPATTNYSQAEYFTDWTNYVSADGGSNWVTVTNMEPTSIYGSTTNVYYSLLTNSAVSGTSLVQRIGTASNVVLRVRGWQRFGGQE